MGGFIRGLYAVARALSTVRAFTRSVKTRSAQPVLRRYVRKAAGRQWGRVLNRAVPPYRPGRRR